jgi:hypothetical protein
MMPAADPQQTDSRGRHVRMRHLQNHVLRQNRLLLDHLVGERKNLCWKLKTNSFCGLQIDDQFELGGLHDRQVGRLLSF